MGSIFTDLGVVIIFATLIAILFKLFRQPLIPAYIIAGIIIGPVAKLVTNVDLITQLSEIGIAFLLFIVGLEIDIERLSKVWKISVIGGLLQFIFVFGLTYLISVLLNFSSMIAFYFGLIASFSSTMIVIKLLSDKNEVDTLHGRIMIGLLLMQDFIAVIALTVLNTLSDFSFNLLFIKILDVLIILVIAYILRISLFPKLFAFVARSKELLFLLSITLLFVFSIIFHYIGISVAIGSFVAGVLIGSLPYAIEIEGKVKSLRDFFLTIFFVGLGMGITVFSLDWKIILIFSIVIMILKPLITFIICAFFNYNRHPSFIASFGLGQVSAFSLIILYTGIKLGHINEIMYSTVVILALISITGTSYFMKYNNQIYYTFRPFLNWFNLFRSSSSYYEYIPKKHDPEVLLVGTNRIGQGVLKKFNKHKNKLLVVDYSPDIIQGLIKRKIPCLYGDISNPEIIDKINFSKLKLVISTVPDKLDNLYEIKMIKSRNKSILLFVTALDPEEALSYYDAGADYVIIPHIIGGEHASLIVEEVQKDVSSVINKKLNHIKKLKQMRKRR